MDKLGAASELFGDVIEIDGQLYIGNSTTKRVPTDIEATQIEQKAVENNAAYQATQYQRDRVKAYPSIGNQLDMIYHAGLGGDVFQAAIKAIKDQFPKGAN